MPNLVIYVLLGLTVVLLTVVLIRLLTVNKGNTGGELRREVSDSITNMSRMLSDNQRTAGENTLNQIKQLEERLKTLETTNEQKLDAMRETIQRQLTGIREDNNRELDKIRGTVDEKLQKTLDEKLAQSFKQVSERLEQVQKGLGEMQSLAAGVGDLKKVLSNVKTRGIMGEIQLGAILSEILAPEQYDHEVTVIPGKNTHVEYAVKLPGEDGNTVWLPIDSKFPGETYGALQDARENGDPTLVAAAMSALDARIKQEAKEIHDKYIEPPYTTDFAILFLPFEGLYAEVVNRGLVEILQRDFKVNVAGPSTMAALLNSLQMGFKTLAIQKRSAEVWQILGAVKTEFSKFSEVLSKAKKRLSQAQEDLDTLLVTRTNVINRRLRDVERLEEHQATETLGLPTDTEESDE